MWLGLNFVWLWWLASPIDVPFQSDSLLNRNFIPVEGNHVILDDNGEMVEIHPLLDEDGILYWHRKVKTPVCLTGECKLIEIGIYWDCSGDFFGIEVYNEHLSKTDHTEFTQQDYEKLLAVLANDWSILREYEQSGLLNEQYEEIDGTSGATKKEIADEAVKNAVYTTYTIWHLIHAGEKEQIILLTLNKLAAPAILDSLIHCGRKKYIYFLMEQFASGNLRGYESIVRLAMKGLSISDDPIYENIAFRALPRLDLNDLSIQEEIASIFPHFDLSRKLKILSAFNKPEALTSKLYQVFANELHNEDEWYRAKVLEILKYGKNHPTEVFEIAQKMAHSKNTVVSTAAKEFLQRAMTLE